MPDKLEYIRFGNPILRKIAKKLSADEIKSIKIKELIQDMIYSVDINNTGVGLSASQVNQSLAIAVIRIKPTPNRPNLDVFNLTLINPKITKYFGKEVLLWEACGSCGTGNDLLYAKVPRHKMIKLEWLDENGNEHEEVFTDFIAHVIQHEVDHHNGILFVDRVKNSKTYMMADEFKKMIDAKSTKA